MGGNNDEKENDYETDTLDATELFSFYDSAFH